MGKEKEFFSKEDLETLRKAIGEAEGKSTGEIVIHLVSKVEKDFTLQGERLFHRLKLDKTQERNGVLILLAPWQRVLRIVADKGIHEKVPEGFWDSLASGMGESFQKGDYVGGLERAVRRAGEELSRFFPCHGRNPNELSDQIGWDGEADRER